MSIGGGDMRAQRFAGFRSLSLAAVLAAAAAPALAQQASSAPASGDTGELESLLGEAVVTTASRSAERASLAPSTVYSITAQEILASGARTLDEALEFGRPRRPMSPSRATMRPARTSARRG